jgi:hypothetical protein
MAALRIADRIDPKVTESFLLMQPDILDASVWLSDGRMHAHVTLHDESALSPGALKLACAEELGIHQTPVEILLMFARKRAA